jgi:hypothetical protein
MCYGASVYVGVDEAEGYICAVLVVVRAKSKAALLLRYMQRG